MADGLDDQLHEVMTLANQDGDKEIALGQVSVCE